LSFLYCNILRSFSNLKITKAIIFVENNRSCIIKVNWLFIVWATICAIAIIDIESNFTKKEFKVNKIRVILILNYIWFWNS